MVWTWRKDRPSTSSGSASSGNALDLGHDFHAIETLPENDRVRYTISPAARKEVLRRLLALNHERAAAEAAQAAAAKPQKKRSKTEESSVPDQPSLFLT